MRLSYLIGEGFKNTFKNKKSTIASLVIMIATMFIFGLFFVISENVTNEVNSLESEQGIAVFVLRDATEEQTEEVGNKLRALEYVNNVSFVSKEEGMEQMKERLKTTQEVLDGYLTRNPLSDKYIVTLTDLTKKEEVKANILKLDNIKSIEASDKTIEKLMSIANMVRLVAMVIFILLLLISIFIIANTIKLTVHARRKEISIMKYVGATNGFIRFPFIVEGMIIGVSAALISIVILWLGYTGVTKDMMGTLSTINFQLLTFSQMFVKVLLVYLGLGIGLGVIGSLISMRRYLEV